MWPVSLKFLHTLRYSHTKITRVDLYRDDLPLETNLPLLSATVSDDYTAEIRRRCDVRLPATADIMALLPKQPELDGGLWPIGNELRIRSGIQYDDGTEELVPMGVFRIANPVVDVDAGGEHIISIKGYDRSRAVNRNRFTEPYVIPQEAFDIPLEIKTLVQNRLPTLSDEEFVLMASDYNPPPRTFLRDNLPWRDCAQEMAKSIGAEVLFDGAGRCVVRPAPNALADPVTFEYVAGEEATVLSIGRSLDDEQGYNGVVASSQSTDNNELFEGQFWDTNPASPTYYDPLFPEKSIYGRVPYFYVSEYIRSNAQAADAAKGIFSSVTGIIETIDFGAICNPAHESGDTVKITEESANIDDVNILLAINFDLLAGTMSSQTRRRAVGEPA